ncbi:putative ABC transporter transmembrane subunit [Oceanicaulis sp. HTCC2633]|nr:putative ABC transporter transmembrane subunit [Oceanicaulis sp. HTCC2633]
MFALLMLVSLIQLAIAVAVAGLVGELFRQLLEDASVGQAHLPLLGGAILATVLAEFARRRLTEALGLDYALSVRMVLLERLLRRTVRGPKPRSRGSQLLPFVGDLTALRMWWADGIARGSSAALIATGILGWLFFKNITLGWWVLAWSGATLALMVAIARPYHRATSRQRRLRGSMTALISDRVAAAHSVMGMGGMRRELNRTEKRIGRMNAASMKRATWSGSMRGLAAAFPLAGFFILLQLAASGSRAGAIAPYEIAGLLTLMGILAGSVADIGRAIELAIPARISGRRLHGRLSEIEPVMPDNATGKAATKAILQLDAFALSPKASGFSAKARKGDIIALEGGPDDDPGRMIEAIAGLQPPAQGELTVSGRQAIGLGQRQRRQWLGIAAAWTPILQGKLPENLFYRMRRGAGLDEIEPLMRKLGLAHLCGQDGQPIALSLREEGSKLSPQDLAAVRLVRALIGSPRLLLLDRATHDLTEAQLRGLAEIIAGWRGVVVMVADSPEIRALCNRCWRIADTGIVEVESSASVTPLHASMDAGRD